MCVYPSVGGNEDTLGLGHIENLTNMVFDTLYEY